MLTSDIWIALGTGLAFGIAVSAPFYIATYHRERKRHCAIRDSMSESLQSVIADRTALRKDVKRLFAEVELANNRTWLAQEAFRTLEEKYTPKRGEHGQFTSKHPAGAVAGTDYNPETPQAQSGT